MKTAEEKKVYLECWNAANAAKVRAYQKAYRRLNRAKRAAYDKVWYNAHKNLLPEKP